MILIVRFRTTCAQRVNTSINYSYNSCLLFSNFDPINIRYMFLGCCYYHTFLYEVSLFLVNYPDKIYLYIKIREGNEFRQLRGMRSAWRNIVKTKWEALKKCICNDSADCSQRKFRMIHKAAITSYSLISYTH